MGLWGREGDPTPEPNVAYLQVCRTTGGISVLFSSQSDKGQRSHPCSVPASAVPPGCTRVIDISGLVHGLHSQASSQDRARHHAQRQTGCGLTSLPGITAIHLRQESAIIDFLAIGLLVILPVVASIAGCGCFVQFVSHLSLRSVGVAMIMALDWHFSGCNHKQSVSVLSVSSFFR